MAFEDAFGGEFVDLAGAHVEAPGGLFHAQPGLDPDQLGEVQGEAGLGLGREGCRQGELEAGRVVEGAAPGAAQAEEVPAAHEPGSGAGPAAPQALIGLVLDLAAEGPPAGMHQLEHVVDQAHCYSLPFTSC